MKWIFHSLRGDEELWKVFWIYGVFFIFLGKIAVVILKLAFTIDYDNPTHAQATQLFWFQTVYGVWLVISLWRCAHNTELAVWGHAMKVTIFFGVIIIGGVLYTEGKGADLSKAVTRIIHVSGSMAATVWRHFQH